MIDAILDCFGERFKADRPWLVVGKGPTFADRDRYKRSAFYVLTLNDAVRFVGPDIAHFVDWDSFRRCAADARWASNVVMPFYPHVDFKPSRFGLAELAEQQKESRELANAGRLFYYHAATAKGRGAGPNDPIVPLKNFSAEAAVWLLAMAGVKTIRTLGVDGGTGYAPEFLAAGLSPLENGRKSFDSQTAEIAKAVKKYDLDYRPLDERDA